jgi:predicted acylesterase/phospholipase RssA
MESLPSELNADLVLEGGGVKGIALAGAVSVLEERGREAAARFLDGWNFDDCKRRFR